MNINNYDDWRLDNNEKEVDVFETDTKKYYHLDGKILDEFEEAVEKLAQDMGLFETEDEVYDFFKKL